MTANAGSGGGSSSGGSRAEGELLRCRANLAGGDLPHAALHLGRALFHDPAHASVYAALADLTGVAGSAEAAQKLFKGDDTTVFPGNAAAICALVAAQGRVPDAVEVLGSVVAAHPEKLWAAAPWFSPESAGSLPLVSIGGAVSTIWQAVDNPAPPETVRALAPWLRWPGRLQPVPTSTPPACVRFPRWPGGLGRTRTRSPGARRPRNSKRPRARSRSPR